MKLKEKYPCGYEYEFEGSGWLINGMFDSKNEKGCPLHGKNCGGSKKKK